MLTAGVDLAAESAGTAVALLDWSGPGTRVRELIVGASDERILAVSAPAACVGIDCAFGWPDAFVAFLARHAAGLPSRDVLDRDGRRLLAYRETDRHAREITGRWPLSVSTDRLGLTAMHCVALLDAVAAAGETVDRSGVQGRVAEVYPGACLRLWGFDTRGYRVDPTRRADLLADLVAQAPWFEPGDASASMIASADAFDAVVAAFAARSHALGLSHPVPVAHLEQARREGWIALPSSGLERLAPR